jgi:hypothetical protein
MVDSDIMEAVYRLEQAQKTLKLERSKLGETLINAAKEYNVTELSRLTGMTRPKIYWLMEKRRSEDRSRND